MYNTHCIKLTRTRATCPIIRICVLVINSYYLFYFFICATLNDLLPYCFGCTRIARGPKLHCYPQQAIL